MSRKIWYFLGLTLALTWSIEGAAIHWIGDFTILNEVGSGLGTMVLIFTGCMYVPTVAVVIVQKGLYDQPLKPLGLSVRLNWWWAVAVLLPLGVALLSIVVSVLWPGVGLSSGKAFLLDQLETAPMSPDQLEAARQSVNEGETLLGPLLALVLFGAALVTGPTLNGLAAFGEEFGWRGFLQKELAPLGFWPSSLTIGLVWGVWHLPLVIGGYNYPGAPIFGIVMMTVFTMAWSPVFAYLVVWGRSVIPAAMAHGTINAIGGITLLFIAGGNRFVNGLMGLAGILVVMGVNGVLRWHQLQNQRAFDEAWAAFRRLGEKEREESGEISNERPSF
jgi:membrane protease YdiL (CAAX protease family)